MNVPGTILGALYLFQQTWKVGIGPIWFKSLEEDTLLQILYLIDVETQDSNLGLIGSRAFQALLYYPFILCIFFMVCIMCLQVDCEFFQCKPLSFIVALFLYYFIHPIVLNNCLDTYYNTVLNWGKSCFQNPVYIIKLNVDSLYFFHWRKPLRMWKKFLITSHKSESRGIRNTVRSQMWSSFQRI